ncbi:MAG: hypothetical protein J2P25_16925 [Nocardiopsaceae bacterium]|nr:hypothetical protein [Nocardiopsaceae bacterium]
MVWWKKKADAPLINIEGMTKEQVKSLLGHPQQQMTEEDYRRGRTVIGGSWMLENEYWFYKNFPRRGWKTMITFNKGRVLNVTQGPRR